MGVIYAPLDAGSTIRGKLSISARGIRLCDLLFFVLNIEPVSYSLICVFMVSRSPQDSVASTPSTTTGASGAGPFTIPSGQSCRISRTSYSRTSGARWVLALDIILIGHVVTEMCQCYKRRHRHAEFPAITSSGLSWRCLTPR